MNYEELIKKLKEHDLLITSPKTALKIDYVTYNSKDVKYHMDRKMTL